MTFRNNLSRADDGRVFVAVATPFVGGASLQANYIQSANPDLSSPDVLVQGPTIPTAALIAGARLLDMGHVANTKQYVGILFVAVGGFTAGTVNAKIIADTQYAPSLPGNTGY